VRSLLAGGLAVVVPVAAYAAQTASDESARPPTDDAGHVRALVEHVLANQAEIQRLSIALNAHQSRVLQISGELAAVRRDLIGAAPASAALTRLVEDARAGETNEPTFEAREASAGLRPLFEMQLATVSRLEEEMRSRERGLLRQLADEEARWHELASRLVQLSVP
jgi:hypothetical protein